MKKFRLFLAGLLYTGTKGVTDEDARKRIVLVNKICLAIAGLILLLAPIICYFLHWPVNILIVVSIDFAINLLVLYCNKKGKHERANLLLFCNQCGAILYFGCAFGELFHLQFMIFFLISIVYLLFETKRARKIGLVVAIVTLVVVQASYCIRPFQPIAQGSVNYLIQSSVIGAVLFLMVAVVGVPYVGAKDRNAELKRANDFIKIFMAQVTHELRAPLDSIHQASHLLRKEIKKDSHLKKIQPLVDITFTASSNASNIVNNVLDMAQIEGGKAPDVVMEPFRLIPLLQKIVEVNQVIANREGIKLCLLLDNEMPDTIVGDALNINQILTNLLSNAIKYGARKSTVEIIARRIADTWELRVTNFGAMIPPEKIDSMFDPFVTGRTGQIQGAGLGLYIVRNKVGLMQGTIDVESKQNGLTTFKVTLPLIEATLSDSDADPVIDLENADLNKVNILVAEDSRLTAFLLSRFLTEMGCSFTMVNNGQELLETAKKRCPDDCPDIIIMDVNMPVLNGEEAILQIKRTPQLSHIPIIVTTGDVSSTTVDKMLAAGADTYLKKPIDLLILQKKIRQFTEKLPLN